MIYTPQQLDAIDFRGSDLLVSAAAGSGKTRVLIDRIVAMILGERLSSDGKIIAHPETRVSVESMLIVTFTNAAAGEMRARLEQSLREAMDRYKDDEQTTAYLAGQIEALPEAHISTMHAFCISKMRRYYHKLDLDPNFKVLTEQAAAIMRDNAMDAALEEGYEEGGESFLRLIEAYGGKRGDKELRGMVRALAFQIESSPTPHNWLEHAVSEGEKPLPKRYVDAFRTLSEQTLTDLRAICKHMREVADALPGMEKYHLMISDDEMLVQGFARALSEEDPVDAVINYLAAVSFPKKPPKSKKMSEEVLEADARIDILHKRCKKAFESISELFVAGGRARIEADRQIVYPYLKEFVALTIRYISHYESLKRARDGVDFGDLEHCMLTLLQDEETCEAIREEVSYVFFDEYQDANPIQEAIVRTLSTSGHLFFVGDVKQAIYRFRRSDPSIFNERYGQYQRGEEGELIFLSQNFRSRREILDFSNRLFESLMTTTLGEIDYQEPGQALVCGGNFPPNPEAVQLVTVVEDKSNRTEEPEAVWIAEEIERLVHEEGCSYSDMAVLMRAPSARIKDYEAVFKRRKIPYYSDNSTVSFQNMEVRLFISMLTVLNDDCLDEPLTAALLSPFGGLNDEDAARIRLHSEEGPFFEAVRCYLSEADDEITAKLSCFYEKIADWRTLLHYESLEEVARRIFEESGYAAFLLGLEGGASRYDNVVSFIDQIAAYEQEEPYGLPGFLHYVEVLSKRSMDSLSPGIVLSENDTCVRIMSIHKSKGLGFKVVFLTDMARRFNLTSRSSHMKVDLGLGLALDVVDLDRLTVHTSFEERIIDACDRRKGMSEEVRLLYVALTRAIDRLYLVAGRKPNEMEKREKEIGSVSADATAFKARHSFADWIDLCIADPHHGLYIGADKSYYVRRVVDMSEDVGQENDLEVPFELPHGDAEALSSISRCLDMQYPFEADTLRPFKQTVSEIAKEHRDEVDDHIMSWPSLGDEKLPAPEPVPVPRFIQPHLSLTATAFGTLMHGVVQQLPLVPMDEETLISKVDDLAARALITPDERNAVDVAMLLRFYQSDFVRYIAQNAINIEQEVSFSLKHKDLQIDGQIDLFFETAEGYVLVDFKTDRTIAPERYRKQLDIYAEALEKARHRSVKKRLLYWLRFAEVSEL